MNRDEIIRMAREARLEVMANTYGLWTDLERFAALVAAAEREACAKPGANDIPTFDEWFLKKTGMTFEDAYEAPFMKREDATRALSRHTREYVTEVIAAAIRSRQ